MTLDGNLIRQDEQRGIRDFVSRVIPPLVKGKRVIDYGCGKLGTCREPQQYRGIIEGAGGEYTGFDKGDELPEGKFPVMLCTQMIQYLPFQWDLPFHTIFGCEVLVLTYPSAWPSCEPTDHHRITKEGMQDRAGIWGWAIERHEELAVLDIPNFRLPLVYGMVARKLESKG